MSSEPGAGQPDKPVIGPEAIIKIFVDQHFHNDRLIWSQLQTLIALQAATIAGAYVARGSSLSVLAVVLGIFFLALLYLYIERLRQCRDASMPLVDRLIDLYADEGVKGVLGEVGGHRLRLYAPLPALMVWRSKRLLVNGHALLISAFVMFLLMDILALVIFPCMSRPG